MKINVNDVCDSFLRLSKSTTNKFWGLLAIISSIDEPIIANKTYRIDSSNVMKFLDGLFFLDEVKIIQYNNAGLYVKFSNEWKSKISSLTLKKSPSFNDIAIFYSHNRDFNENTDTQSLIDYFIYDCNIAKNGIETLFTWDENKILKVNNYNSQEFINVLENKCEYRRNENYHLSFESGFFIQSRPSELKRAPFIQTLYSSDSIKQLLLLSDYNLEDYYPSFFKVQKIDKNRTLKISDFYYQIPETGLKFGDNLFKRFINSLITKPFVILTGLSGSGKTKLAQAFAMWLCGSGDQYKIVPVGADWTNREPLLGFPNALRENAYVSPESGVLQLILAAQTNPEKPHFLILDEMNLSHVERYFADFLSAMESGEEIFLHAGDEPWDSIPPKIKLPKNLFIVGTVNIDETTYMFSPKVLDRANVIEFRVTAEEMIAYLSQSGNVDLEAIKGQGASMEQSFVNMAQNKEINYSDQDDMNAALIGFFSQLKVAGAEFGYRTASEIRRFAAVTEAMETAWKTNEIIDVVIMQKLLPKLHGSRRKLEPVLKTLISLCITKDAKTDDYLQSNVDADTSKVLYPIALEKLQRMYRGLIDNGFTSYAEA